MSNSWLALYIAYSIIWVALFAYIVYLHYRQRSVQKDIDNLKEQVAKNAK